jgi:hypothetical protein
VDSEICLSYTDANISQGSNMRRVIVRRSSVHGKGVFAMRPLAAGERVVEYKGEVYPDDPSQQISHDTIYTAIYARPCGELRRQLVACLRHHRTDRMPRSRGTDRRGQIPDMVSIHVRPPEVDDRVMPGH